VATVRLDPNQQHNFLRSRWSATPRALSSGNRARVYIVRVDDALTYRLWAVSADDARAYAAGRPLRAGKTRRSGVRENPIELAPLLWAGGLLAGAAAVGGAIYAVQQARNAAAPAPAANPFPTQFAPVSPVTTSPASAAAIAAAAQQAAAQASQAVTQAAGGALSPAAPASPSQTFPAGYNPYAGTTNPAPTAPAAPLPTVTAPVTSGAQAVQPQAPGTTVPTTTTFPAGYNPYAGTTNPAPVRPVTIQPFNNGPASAPTNTPAPAPAPTNTGVVPVAAGGTCPPGYTKNGFDCIAPNAPGGGCPPGTTIWQGKCQPTNGGPCPPGTKAWQGGCAAT
jgi:hypothetical protein